MQKLSIIANLLTIGHNVEALTTLRACTIDNATGAISNPTSGNDLSVNNGVTASPTGQFVAEKIWNAVWNDIVDFQLVCDEIVFGKCYYDTFDGAKICNTRCQKSVIGIASDTFGFAVGQGRYKNQVPIAIGGWVLAYVDRVYDSGTPLTCSATGELTEITVEEKMHFPERIVGIYKKPELDEFFGSEKAKVKVNGRHWVKVK